jgi:DNA-binding transcriptional LysR family regulator
MELRQLQMFLAVARELSFTRAAAALGVAQPPLSQQIRRLEAELEVPLFRRTTRSVQLTAAGAVLREEARAVLERLDAAVAATRRAGAGLSGHLAVGFVGPAVLSVLPAVIRASRAALPDVEIGFRELTTVEQMEALAAGTVQVGFARLPPSAPGIAVEPVLREHLVLAVARDPRRLSGNGPVALAELAHERFVFPSPRFEPGLNELYRTLCRNAGFTPLVAQEASQIHTILALVMEDLGVAFVPSSMQRERLPRIRYRKLAESVPVDLSIVWRRESEDPLVRRFVEVVRTMRAKPER